MGFYTAVFLSSSIFIAGVIALIRFGRIGRVYYPFIFLIWLGCINETISYILVFNNMYNVVNGVIYDLLESLLLLWFFNNLGVFEGKKWLLYFFIPLFIGTWSYESFFAENFGHSLNTYFNIVYSFSIVLLSISAINDVLFREKELVKNSIFLACTGILIFFTYKTVTEAFTLFGLSESMEFGINVFIIQCFINLFCNLIYAIAITWMNKKDAFTLQF
jgi:hypothetical protein